MATVIHEATGRVDTMLARVRRLLATRRPLRLRPSHDVTKEEVALSNVSVVLDPDQAQLARELDSEVHRSAF